MKKDKDHKCEIIKDLTCDICGGELCHRCSSFYNIEELPSRSSFEILIFRICDKCNRTPMNKLIEKDRELMINLFNYDLTWREKEKRIEEITVAMDKSLNFYFQKIKNWSKEIKT